MPYYCQYHPAKLAHWLCPYCQKAFCPSCISPRTGGYSGKETWYFCPSCNRQAQWIGAANTMVPFWERIHKFFQYPLSLQPLSLMVVLALLSVMFSGKGLMPALFGFVVWAVMLKYAFAALRTTAKGDLRPPPINAKTVGSDIELVFKQIALFVIGLFASVYAGVLLGPLGSLLVLLAGILLLPAMIIVLISTEKLLHAINPLVFVSLAARIGWGYLVMFLFLAILYFAPFYLGGYIVSLMPEFSHRFLFNLAQNYYTLVSYHLMGYVVLQYHQNIGYEVNYEDFKDPAAGNADAVQPITDPVDKTLADTAIMVKEGRHDEAIKQIEEVAAVQGFTDVKLSERYYSLLEMKKASEKLSQHGPVHLTLLIGAGAREKACAVYKACLKMDENFVPEASSLFKIAGWQNGIGKSREAILTFKHFVQTYPDHHLVPMAYFRIAEILTERIGDPEKARRVLHMLIKRYPEHDVMAQAKHLLKQVTAV
ncbi:MAG: tetratricopeptide repeat protein [Desulfobacteraceae bacterium]|nr:tetratricopeptide repeat protein [Desulfobacteraceae bacterium]